MKFSLFGFECTDEGGHQGDEYSTGCWLFSFKIDRNDEREPFMNPRALLGIHHENKLGLVVQFLFFNLKVM